MESKKISELHHCRIPQKIKLWKPRNFNDQKVLFYNKKQLRLLGCSGPFYGCFIHFMVVPTRSDRSVVVPLFQPFSNDV